MLSAGVQQAPPPAPGAVCGCVSSHTPTVRQPVNHPIVPLAWGGTLDPANLVVLCPTTSGNVDQLLGEYLAAGGPPGTLRYYGPLARQLAATAWAARPRP